MRGGDAGLGRRCCFVYAQLCCVTCAELLAELWDRWVNVWIYTRLWLCGCYVLALSPYQCRHGNSLNIYWLFGTRLFSFFAPGFKKNNSKQTTRFILSVFPSLPQEAAELESVVYACRFFPVELRAQVTSFHQSLVHMLPCRRRDCHPFLHTSPVQTQVWTNVSCVDRITHTKAGLLVLELLVLAANQPVKRPACLQPSQV